MIIRIVKMEFLPENCAAFEALFDERKSLIASFPGCKHLSMLKAEQPGNVYFTYSHWNDASDLENYRHSELFKDTWAKTKVLFAEKAQAWSTSCMFDSALDK